MIVEKLLTKIVSDLQSQYPSIDNALGYLASLPWYRTSGSALSRLFDGQVLGCDCLQTPSCSKDLWTIDF